MKFIVFESKTPQFRKYNVNSPEGKNFYRHRHHQETMKKKDFFSVFIIRMNHKNEQKGIREKASDGFHIGLGNKFA